jgi:ferric-dicitrate binding protein FerR (iron transport regulator)
MDELTREIYRLEDFVSDETFINYHLKSNIVDHLSWEKWLLDNPEKRYLVEKAKEIINELSFTISEKEYREELKKIVSAIDRETAHGSIVQLSGGNNFFKSYQRRKRTLQFLVPFLLIIIAGGYWLIQLTKNSSEKLTETVNNSTLPLILTLSDSTVVSLDPGSYLQYPLYFKDKERIVYLHGNAQFIVKRNTAHPFKVHDENIVATVLGTVFNMKSSGDSAIVVELLKGKLNVEIINSRMETEQSVLLEPNERAVYVRNDKHLYKNLFVTEHHLSFSKSNFEEIAAQVKNVFDITLINESPKRDWRFTGDFKNSTAKGIVENICLVKKLSFVIKGDTIVIK